MASAVWCWEAAKDRAFASRMAALTAAQCGDHAEAIRLTCDAQRHDRIAQDWRDAVPAWQWKIYWAFKKNEDHQHDKWG